MATTIKVTVINAQTDTKGLATITLELDDGIGKWQKIYTYNQTEPIVFSAFKDRVIADIKKDLKVKDQLANLTAQIGKSFNIVI